MNYQNHLGIVALSSCNCDKKVGPLSPVEDGLATRTKKVQAQLRVEDGLANDTKKRSRPLDNPQV